jgi:hypothetical protein
LKGKEDERSPDPGAFQKRRNRESCFKAAIRVARRMEDYTFTRTPQTGKETQSHSLLVAGGGWMALISMISGRSKGPWIPLYFPSSLLLVKRERLYTEIGNNSTIVLDFISNLRLCLGYGDRVEALIS